MTFQYGEAQMPQGAILAYIPGGVFSEQQLFDVLFEQLRLPDYFGDNWNALEECLRDLSWLESGTVVLVHKDVPLRQNRPALKIYLSILADAVAKWEDSDDRSLVVTFPEGAELEIESCVGSAFEIG